jgi:hypothetical protein
MYARNTTVSCEKSKTEIEKILTRYGATHFAYATMPEGSMVQFVFNGKRIKFLVPMPGRPTSAPGSYGYDASMRRWEQKQRVKWRALALVIKAKLEAVASGICTFEEEFLAHIVLPNGQTAGQHLIPRIDEAYKTGQVPALGWEGQ